MIRNAIGAIARATAVTAFCAAVCANVEITEVANGQVAISFTVNPPDSPTPDIVVTLPGTASHSFRALYPEWIVSDNVDLLTPAQAALHFSGPFHTAPITATTTPDGALRGVMSAPGVVETTLLLKPRESYVDITWTLRNLCTETLQNPYADFCLNLNAGGGGWANMDFLPHSTLDRAADGAYWHDVVAARGAYVHSGGNWVKLSEAAGLPLDASIIAVVNETDTQIVFQMWDGPMHGEPWINNENACMHLRPRLGSALGPGGSVTIHGRQGITRNGLGDVWQIYQAMIVPEPGTPALMATGLLGLLFRRVMK